MTRIDVNSVFLAAQRLQNATKKSKPWSNQDA
jgi:hypothetical protein